GFLIKRVIGVPGDTVEMRDKTLLLNGRTPKEDYIVHIDGSGKSMSQRDNFGPEIVRTGSYFLLGDNRDNSLDSRFFGDVPRAGVRSRGLSIPLARPRPRIGHRLDTP